MPSFDPDVNPITQAERDLEPLFDADPIALYGDETIAIQDSLDDENRSYPFVTLALGARNPDGSVDVYINCHAAAVDEAGSQELVAELERVTRRALDDTSHAMSWQRSGRAVNMEGHVTCQVVARYPKWRR